MEEPRQKQPTVNTIENKVSRRNFLVGAGVSGIMMATPLLLSETALAEQTPSHPTHSASHRMLVPLTVNGNVQTLMVDPRATLLDALRESAHLTGTKKGCDHGQCGACTVHVNGRRINSCLTLAVMHTSDKITTVEGLGQPDHLHPLQSAFMTHDAFQCGYCTPGQLKSAAALLQEPCGSADADVKELMSGNICRCGAYGNIVRAIQSVRYHRAGASDEAI